MILISKSIHNIDREGEQVIVRTPPLTFNTYISELIDHITGNVAVRTYKTRSVRNQVISSALETARNVGNQELFSELAGEVAERLLLKEIAVQERVERLQVQVRRGTLLQALLHNEEDDGFVYLLAKVEHSGFVDESDFIFKTGFSDDKKTIWKTCLFEIENISATEINAKVYTDGSASYWSDAFLELEELNTNEINTYKAFKAIDEVLHRKISSTFPQNYAEMRNSFITYFKCHDHIDYDTMISELVGGYQTDELGVDTISSLVERLTDLPTSKKFDRQFQSAPRQITAKLKKIYNVRPGIEVRITDAVPDWGNTIFATQDNVGTRYLQIIIEDETTYNELKRNDN